MLNDQTTVFKGNDFFQGDVIITTALSIGGTWADVKVVVIPDSRVEHPMGGAMVWDFGVPADKHDDHRDLLDAIERREYETAGCSVVEDIIGEPAPPTLREVLTEEVLAYNEDLPDEQVRDIVEVESDIDRYIGDLKRFETHLHETIEELDVLSEIPGVPDVTVEVNGQSITIPMNADLYESLVDIIRTEIKYEEKENGGN